MRNKKVREEVYSTHYKDTQNEMCKGYLCLTTEIPLSSSLLSQSAAIYLLERERGNSIALESSENVVTSCTRIGSLKLQLGEAHCLIVQMLQNPLS